MCRKINFQYEWAGLDNTPVEEEKVTNASFCILIYGESITDFHDNLVNAYKTTLHLPLYPLGEWFVLNWWSLFGEYSEHELFEYRHNMKYTGSGFSFPDISFIPQTNDQIYIKWEPLSLNNHFVEFLKSGNAYISKMEFQTLIFEFVNSIVERLNQFGLKNTILQNEWKIINESDEEESQFCLVAAAMGEEAPI